MRTRRLVAAAVAVALLLGRPAGVDAGWAGMLVQVTAMLSQIRSMVSTAEAHVAQAGAEMRGLLDPGGLVSSVRSLADWRGIFSDLTDLGPLWEPVSASRALVDGAVADYQAARGIGSHDFGSVGGFLDFLDSQPLGWSAGKASVWQALVDDVGLPAELRDEVRAIEQLRRRVLDLRYAGTVGTRLAASAVLGDRVAGEYAGRGMLDDSRRVLDSTRRLMGGPSDAAPALSQAEADGVATELAALRAGQSAGALALRAAELRAEARGARLDAFEDAEETRRTLDRLAELSAMEFDPVEDDIGNNPMSALGSGGFMGAWVDR